MSIAMRCMLGCMVLKQGNWMKIHHSQNILYVGFTDEEALRLASRHKYKGHFNHKMTIDTM